MAIQIGGTTVIDDSRNILNVNDVRVGVVTISASSGDIETQGIIRADSVSIPPKIGGIYPAAGSTDVDFTLEDSLITVAFNSFESIQAGVGTITLRRDSAAGTIIESFDVQSSNRLTFTGSVLSVDVTPVAQLGQGYELFLVIPDGAVVTNTFSFDGLNVAGVSTYSFRSINIAPGCAYGGGYIMCNSGGIRWIVSPRCAETAASWPSAPSVAVSRAQSCTGCTGWFLPTAPQLQNPGYTCRAFWDCYSLARYWSSTQHSGPRGCYVDFTSGTSRWATKPYTFCVRAFRCITY